MNKKKWYRPATLSGKILLTVSILLIIRLGCNIPVPFISRNYREALTAGSIMEMLNTFSGGAFEKMSLFALGITPYITASIILQLLSFAIPRLGDMFKEKSEASRKKYRQVTVGVSVALAVIQGTGLSIVYGKRGFFTHNTWYAVLATVLIWTAGVFIMAVAGEYISKNGIGNGISLILTMNIIAGLPADMKAGYEMFVMGHKVPVMVLVLALILTMALLYIAAVYVLNTAEKVIKVTYPSGRTAAHTIQNELPIKFNTGGVMPVIFTSTMFSLPLMFADNKFTRIFSQNYWFRGGKEMIYSTGFLIYGLLVVFFAYFYNTISFNTSEIATNLKKAGGTINGIRPGTPTKEYLDRKMKYMTLLGALCLFILCEIPTFIGHISGFNMSALGGTSMLIIAGTIVETVNAVHAEKLGTVKKYTPSLLGRKAAI